jgi:hypothetical protein
MYIETLKLCLLNSVRDEDALLTSHAEYRPKH